MISMLYYHIWRFLLQWGYPQNINFQGTFHEINHPFEGTPHFRKLPYRHQRVLDFPGEITSLAVLVGGFSGW
jgi:hypothetical protein